MKKSNKEQENYNIPPEFAALFCAISFCRASDVDSEAWRLERESNSLVRCTWALIDLSS